MIFIDSSYYIARLIEDDKFHKRAIELEPQLNEKRYINSTVLNETLNAFGSMGGAEINELFIYYNSSINFSDCTILESMQKLGINKIVSFDSDFSKIKGLSVIK